MAMEKLPRPGAQTGVAVAPFQFGKAAPGEC